MARARISFPSPLKWQQSLAGTSRDLWTGASVNWALDREGESLESLILRRVDFLFDQLDPRR